MKVFRKLWTQTLDTSCAAVFNFLASGHKMGSDLQICPPLPCKAILPYLTGLMGAELCVTNFSFQTAKPKCFPVERNIKATT